MLRAVPETIGETLLRRIGFEFMIQNIEKPKDLFFSSWFVVDQKWNALVLLIVALTVVTLVWWKTGSSFWIPPVVIVLCLPIWRIFFPIHYELNTDGVVYRILGRTRLIAWDDIKIYKIKSHGILMLPHRDRFSLEDFRGFFLPVPTSLMPEVLYRFRVFVDRIQD